VGVGWATLRDVDPIPAEDPSIEILELDRAVTDLQALDGQGSGARRLGLLGDLLVRATAAEAAFIRRVLTDARGLADDWSDPAAWEGMTAAGGVDLPGDVAGIVGLDELVIHGWDLAKATGQPAGYDGPGLEEVFRLVTEFRGGGIEGLFGPEVPVPDDAPVLDRILGVSGRDPGWQPPGGAS